MGARGALPGSVLSVIQALESAAGRRINAERGTPGAPVWQRGYYEHILRSQGELHRVRRYVELNPVHWVLDREKPHRR